MNVTRRPRECSEKELQKVGVELLTRFHQPYLTCHNCGEAWYAEECDNGLRMKAGYWKCPHGCNTGGDSGFFRIKVGGRWFPQ